MSLGPILAPLNTIKHPIEDHASDEKAVGHEEETKKHNLHIICNDERWAMMSRNDERQTRKSALFHTILQFKGLT